MTICGSRSPRAWSGRHPSVDLDVDVPGGAPPRQAGHPGDAPPDHPLDPGREARLLVHETSRLIRGDEEATWPATARTSSAHLTERLATFRGERALFIHNALHYWGRGYMGEGDHATHVEEFMANCVAAIALGDHYLHAVAPAVDAGVDAGLVQMSSATARIVYPGYANYGAAKAAIEQWVRCVRAERDDRGKGPWVCAIRPGFVDTRRAP